MTSSRRSPRSSASSIPTPPSTNSPPEPWLRLQLGIPAEVIDLAQQLDVQLTRQQWARLGTAGITTTDTIRQATHDDIAKVLGDATSASALEAAADAWIPAIDLPEPLLPTPIE